MNKTQQFLDDLRKLQLCQSVEAKRGARKKIEFHVKKELNRINSEINVLLERKKSIEEILIRHSMRY